jgi:hypothetical protein
MIDGFEVGKFHRAPGVKARAARGAGEAICVTALSTLADDRTRRATCRVRELLWQIRLSNGAFKRWVCGDFRPLGWAVKIGCRGASIA